MKRSIRILSWWMLNGKLFYSWSCYWLWFMIRIGGNKWKCMHSPCIVIFWEHSSVLAWRIPGTGEPGELPPMGSHRVGHDWSDLAAAVFHYIYIYYVLHFLCPFICWWIFSLFLHLGYCEYTSNSFLIVLSLLSLFFFKCLILMCRNYLLVYNCCYC